MFISPSTIARHDDNGRRPQRQGRAVAMSAAAAVALSGLAISPSSARVAVTAKTAVRGGPVTVPVTSGPTTTNTTTSVVGGSIAPVGAISFGRVVPGADASMGTGYFKATGSIGATITARQDVFNVVSITTYQVTKELVSVDPGELPPGAKPVRTWQTVYTADQSVAGGGPLTIPSGDVVAITVGVRNAQAAAQGTMTLTSGAITQAIPLSLSVGAVKASLDSTNLTITQGRSGRQIERDRGRRELP